MSHSHIYTLSVCLVRTLRASRWLAALPGSVQIALDHSKVCKTVKDDGLRDMHTRSILF
jgi:hypothetical protein